MLSEGSISIIQKFIRNNNTISPGGFDKKWFHAEMVVPRLTISLCWLGRDDVGRANLPSPG